MSPSRRGERPDIASIDYGSYLALDELLALQRLRSSPEHPDELLFIVVHQASELWFKAILFELDQLTTVLARYDTGRAVWHMGRLNALMRIVSAQLDSLETLPPQHFAEFRGYLGASSGSQSVQFRAIEAASGLRDAHFMHALEEHGEIPPLVARHLARPTAWPAGDLALRKALAAFYPELSDARAAGERFHPFQNLTAHYLQLALLSR